jgi:hypothetical protein
VSEESHLDLRGQEKGFSDSQDIRLFKFSFDFMQAFIAVVGFNPFNWKSPTPGGVDSSLFVGEARTKRFFDAQTD